MSAFISVTEQRYRDSSGERFLKNGKVRCQALSKNKLRKWREATEDYETPSDDLWPECQCDMPAVTGMFVCHFHGGKRNEYQIPRSILDVLPVDLGDKLRVLLENPIYLSNKEDIALISARQWELLEQLQSTAGSEEAWGTVSEALSCLTRGDDISAMSLLRDALKTTVDTKDIWTEYYKTEALLKDLRSSEVRTAKELKLMATVDEVNALILHIQRMLQEAAKRFIDDSKQQTNFLNFAAGEIARFTNLSPVTVVTQLTAGSGNGSGDS